MNKKNKCIAGIMSLALVATLAGGTILGVSANQRNQSKVTGQSVTTINEYESTGASTYIGHGYDVISQGYVNAGDVVKTAQIFNIQDKENGKNIRNTNIVVDTGSNKYQDYQLSSDSQNDLIKQYAVAVNATELADQSWFPFSKITPSISASYNKTKDYKNHTYYRKVVREMDTAYATWLVDEDEYYDYLTDSFKKDVVSMNANELFSKYGTHFLKSVKLGGRLDFTYALESDSKSDIDNVAADLDLQINNVLSMITEGASKLSKMGRDVIASPKTGEGESDANLPNRNEIKLPEGKPFAYGSETNRFIKNVDANLYITCFGGSKIEFASIEGENANASQGAKDWIASIPNKPSLIGVQDKSSLVPVWTLLDGLYANGDITEEVYKTRKAELEAAFNQAGKDNFEKIVSADFKNTVSSVKPIELETKSVAVRTETNFNKKYTLNEKFQALHEGSPLGTLILVNAKENGDSYSATSRGLKIRFRVDQDTKHLSSGVSKLFNHRLISSTCMGTVDGYGKVFGNKVFGLGKGAYYVQVTYNDQTTEKLTGTNVLKNANKNDTITLLDSANLNVDQHDGIDKVSVVFLHSTAANSSTLRAYAQDWITEYELNFN